MNHKNKVCVYAICKNEEQFVQRWVESMEEADEIVVLDTGSSDDTVAALRKLNVTVNVMEIKPWRFDKARNESLKFVPTDADICICTDLDEVFEPGWRAKLEEIWEPNTTRLRYNFNWSLDQNNVPLVNFYIEKMHSRHDYQWTHPVHEVLTYIGKQKEVLKITDTITVNHYPDHTKSRSNYLPLLEMSVQEDPDDDRNMHYLGREYMFHGEWNKSIDTLIKHLSLPKAVWKDERCASMRFISRCYLRLHRIKEAEMWLKEAIAEAPHLRDPYVQMALLHYSQNNWVEVEKYCNLALLIAIKTKSYINEVFSWDNTIYDLLSLSYHYQGNNVLAMYFINKAIEMNPDDERLLKNKELMMKSI